MKESVEAAGSAAVEFDGLYEESAKNLLARTPDLMLLLGAYEAGRQAGVREEVERRKPVQEMLGDD